MVGIWDRINRAIIRVDETVDRTSSTTIAIRIWFGGLVACEIRSSASKKTKSPSHLLEWFFTLDIIIRFEVRATVEIEEAVADVGGTLQVGLIAHFDDINLNKVHFYTGSRMCLEGTRHSSSSSSDWPFSSRRRRNPR